MSELLQQTFLVGVALGGGTVLAGYAVMGVATLVRWAISKIRG